MGQGVEVSTVLGIKLVLQRPGKSFVEEESAREKNRKYFYCANKEKLMKVTLYCMQLLYTAFCICFGRLLDHLFLSTKKLQVNKQFMMFKKKLKTYKKKKHTCFNI